MAGSRRTFVYWFAAYSALAVIVTFPLALKLSSVITDTIADPLLSTSLLWWNAHVLPFTERWWNGFAFFPSTGMLAFSDHRLGESLLATPLQWLGLAPSTAYNITVLATFPLCAIGAHALAFVLTRRHDSAAICGLAYGFNPYRVAHLSHLELLAAFGMPVALAALHMAHATRKARWIVPFTGALLVQALCTSYYIAFFAVLLLLWVLWFVRRQDLWLLPYLAAAAVFLGATLSPIVLGYMRIHAAYGMNRNIGEVLAFSADITSLVTATGHSLLWGWTATLNGREGQIFPGLWITLLAVSGIAFAVRGRKMAPAGTNWITIGFGALAAAYVVAAFFAGTIFKPLSVALAAGAIAIGATSRARDAWTRRSPLAFYAVLTAAMFLCSFGPKPTFLDRQVLYEPPYAWLMRLPIFSSEIRAPARFAMLAILALAVAGALAFERLALRPSARRVAAGLLMTGVLADGSIRAIPLPELPPTLPSASVSGFAAVMELPLGDFDASAMYRATFHDRPIVNGDSGYLPASYAAMVAAVRAKDATVLDTVPIGHVVIAVNSRIDPGGFWDRTLSAHPRATRAGGDASWQFFTITPATVALPCSGSPLPIARVSDERGELDVRTFADNNPGTRWFRTGQRAGDRLVLDLGKAAQPCALMVSLGNFAFAFPRRVSVATSVNGSDWETAFDGSTAAPAIRAARENPKDVWVPFVLKGGDARFIRLQLEVSAPDIPLQITELAVR